MYVLIVVQLISIWRHTAINTLKNMVIKSWSPTYLEKFDNAIFAN